MILSDVLNFTRIAASNTASDNARIGYTQNT